MADLQISIAEAALRFDFTEQVEAIRRRQLAATDPMRALIERQREEDADGDPYGRNVLDAEDPDDDGETYEEWCERECA